MTPAAKMVTVGLTTGVGECMELMRKHGIRHLPVMATAVGEDRHQAIPNLQVAAERYAARAHPTEDAARSQPPFDSRTP